MKILDSCFDLFPELFTDLGYKNLKLGGGFSVLGPLRFQLNDGLPIVVYLNCDEIADKL